MSTPRVRQRVARAVRGARRYASSALDQHPRWNRAACIAGVVLVVVGCVVHWSASMVRGRLLDAELYTETLDRQGVYERVYSEVLIDPAVRDVTGQLLGDLRIDGGEPADAAALSNAILRLALPPTTLRQATEQTVERTLAYVRGEVDEVRATVDLSEALRTLDVTADTLLAAVLTRVPRHVVDNLPAYEAGVRVFIESLESGRVPEWVPVLGGSAVSEAAIVAVIERASEFALPADVADQVVVSVSAGDQADALIGAASEFASSHLTSIADDPALEAQLRVDLFDALGRRAGQPQRDVIRELNTMRSWASWLPGWSGPVALGAIAVGISLIWIGTRRAWITMLVLSGAFAAGTVGTVAVRALAERSFGSPMGKAVATSGSRAWPPAVVSIMRDVDRSVGASLDNAASNHTTRLLLVAVTCLASALAIGAREWVRRLDFRMVAAVWGGVLVVTGWAAVWLPAPTAHVADRRCNGHSELCERPYDQIVQAATHNSMSSPRVVRIWPEHDGDIEAQLNYGIRTLLIDTHYWEAVETPAELSSAEQYLPPEAAAYLFEQLDERLAARPGTYLCHARCAYGAVSLEAALRTVKSFLDANPNEVVTLIVQDGITVADTEAAFRATGLEDYLFADQTDSGWPTLGEMIDADRRLVVFAETGRPGPDWYRPAFEQIHDTPFRVTSPSDFTCATARGRPDSALFLMNHWVSRSVPDRADAARVNAREFIVERAGECAADGGRLPNFIAVDFFSIGDVLGAVDTLNGLAG